MRRLAERCIAYDVGMLIMVSVSSWCVHPFLYPVADVNWKISFEWAIQIWHISWFDKGKLIGTVFCCCGPR